MTLEFQIEAMMVFEIWVGTEEVVTRGVKHNNNVGQSGHSETSRYLRHVPVVQTPKRSKT